MFGKKKEAKLDTKKIADFIFNEINKAESYEALATGVSSMLYLSMMNNLIEWEDNVKLEVMLNSKADIAFNREKEARAGRAIARAENAYKKKNKAPADTPQRSKALKEIESAIQDYEINKVNKDYVIGLVVMAHLADLISIDERTDFFTEITK